MNANAMYIITEPHTYVDPYVGSDKHKKEVLKTQSPVITSPKTFYEKLSLFPGEG